MTMLILVAEDETVLADDLCETFEEAGFAVEGPHAAISAAMLACQKARPDLVVLDVRLNDGEAYELAQKLLDDQVRVIFHSDAADHGDVAARFPEVPRLLKPSPPADVLRAVKQVLGSDCA